MHFMVTKVSQKSQLFCVSRSHRLYRSHNWGIRLSLVPTVVKGGGINFLALDKPTYQTLASYWAEEPQKSSCVGGGGWVVFGF